VLLALDQVRSSNLLVLNGDTFFAVRLEALSAYHVAQQADCTIALFRSRDIQRYQGVELAPDGRITKLGTSHSDSAAVNGGVYIFRTASLRALPWRTGQQASLEKDFLPWGLANSWAVCGIESQASFIDIGLPEDYRRASTVLAL
jgi:D-glycero-alpha-D-manno-heptose 1-phosphate guanylyltransferase